MSFSTLNDVPSSAPEDVSRLAVQRAHVTRLRGRCQKQSVRCRCAPATRDSFSRLNEHRDSRLHLRCLRVHRKVCAVRDLGELDAVVGQRRQVGQRVILLAVHEHPREWKGEKRAMRLPWSERSTIDSEISRARPRLGPCGADWRRRECVPAALTPQEDEIASLAASGLSNKHPTAGSTCSHARSQVTSTGYFPSGDHDSGRAPRCTVPSSASAGVLTRLTSVLGDESSGGRSHRRRPLPSQPSSGIGLARAGCSRICSHLTQAGGKEPSWRC
jgi:hypothetical protein